MRKRQSGLSLIAVAIGMAALAGVAMLALFSMRHERNYFAESVKKVSEPVAAAVAAPPSSAPMRKCTINGKTVISNTECRDSGKVIQIHDSKGIESPKAPPPEPKAPQTAQDKMIEKATQ